MQNTPLFCRACGAENAAQTQRCSACGQDPRRPSGALLRSRYALLERLGHGGFGEVYKAVDTQLANRPVAIKAMNQDGLSSQEYAEAVRAFEGEAQILATLRHSHLPHIYDYFSEAGRWYLVMEYIEGKTLEQYQIDCGGAGLQVGEVLDIGLQLCGVLHYLHTQNPPVIFRDLKPANVMRSPEGYLYLIDFGIARHFKPGKRHDTVALGSPGYAAPEQYGQAHTTPRTDIYGLGVTLIHLLTGQSPDAPVPFTTVLPPALSFPELQRCLVGMIAADPARRPDSMQSLQDTLQWLKELWVARQRGDTRLADYLAAPGTFRSGAAQTNRLPGTPMEPLFPMPPLMPKGGTYAVAPGVSQNRGGPTIGAGNAQEDAPAVPRRFLQHTGAVNGIAWSPDGLLAVSVGTRSEVRVWEAASGKVIYAEQGDEDLVLYTVAWSPDGRYYALAGDMRAIQVRDAASGSPVCLYRGHRDAVRAVAWSPDGLYLASTGYDQTVQVWDAQTGDTVMTYANHDWSAYAVAWSPDGQYIVSGGVGSTVDLWKVETGKLLHTYHGHADRITALAWPPDGTHIASGSADGTVRVWERQRSRFTRGSQLIYRGHSDRVNAVAWSPYGKYLASASFDQTVQVWIADTGELVDEYQHSAEVNAVAWSPLSTCIASGDQDGAVQFTP